MFGIIGLVLMIFGVYLSVIRKGGNINEAEFFTGLGVLTVSLIFISIFLLHLC